MTRTALFLSVACGLVGFSVGFTQRSRPCTWDLVPVVVASVDIAAGTKVRFDMISQRSVPEHLVTASIVRPDSASAVVGHTIENPVQAGDLLRWADFPEAMSREWKEGDRAVRLELDEALIRGDRVDVWGAGLLVAENAEVLTNSGSKRWVKVQAGQAELVVRSGGPLTAVLRPRQ